VSTVVTRSSYVLVPFAVNNYHFAFEFESLRRSVIPLPTSGPAARVPITRRASQEERVSDSITFCAVAIDCPDAGRLAAFYAEITGGKVTYQDPQWATVKGPGGRIDFQTAPGHQPPTWPDKTSSMQMHLDLDVDDLDAAEARVLAAGATKYDFQPGHHFRVFADPAGHPFCLSTSDVPDNS
jgi:hypothetical protein